MRELPLVALIGLACAPFDAKADAYSPRVGQPHPDFTLPSITDGRPVTLSQFRGQKVLLVHLASW